jgi:hypothetical protein
MGEAKQKLQKLRDGLLWQAEGWCFPATVWESELVEEILNLPSFKIPRLSNKELRSMGMPPGECHSNTRWYERNDPTKETKSVTGWWLQGVEFILHSVLGRNGQFMCITPTARNETEIQFFPDTKIEWIEADNHIAAFRNGREIGLGVRPFPAFTIAQNEAIRARLLSGMSPHQASEFSAEEINNLLLENLTEAERILVGWPVSP